MASDEEAFSQGSASNFTTTISLQEVLTQISLAKGSITHRDRYYLALTLASSVLQLDGTEWMHNSLRSCDILFASLIELALGKPISSLQEPQDNFENSPSITEWRTVQRLVSKEAISNRVGEIFSNVIKCCIEYQFSQDMDVNMDSEDFQKAVYNDVVAPLMKQIKIFDGRGGIP
ncbi:MAG: hypothetical protein M1834_007652 [Cirrosporium novae-zelandiae]|nr:MAG: hypothetical protein M1834_007652 [Cirrosporium novae-zelandiae]